MLASPTTHDIELSLSVLCIVAAQGDTLTVQELADFCDCSTNEIKRIEQSAKRKLVKQTQLKKHLH